VHGSSLLAAAVEGAAASWSHRTSSQHRPVHISVLHTQTTNTLPAHQAASVRSDCFTRLCGLSVAQVYLSLPLIKLAETVSALPETMRTRAAYCLESDAAWREGALVS
jgi:hypothetical protein